jgi:paraquat-inducible protein A
MSTDALTACHECDLLQREPHLPLGGVARCGRCCATLYRSHPESVDRTLALTLASIVLFVIANWYPIVGLEVNGDLVQTTLFGAVRALWNDEMQLVAGLVFTTTILMPLVELVAMASLLLPLRLKLRPPYAAPLFRAIRTAEPWGMVEVFMLGVLVALVKLAHIAQVVPGIAAWCFGVLMVLFAASAVTFDPREVWTRLSVAR